MLRKLYEKLSKRIQEDPADKLRSHGAVIGEAVHIYDGAGSYIDYEFAHLLSIGNHVTISNARILLHDASMGIELGCIRTGRITIGDHVFIGLGSTILPNVTIGNRVIVGAGSVVTKDIPENSVAVGNPARVIGTYDDYIEKCRAQLKESPHFTARDLCTEEDLKKMKEEKADYMYLGRFLD